MIENELMTNKEILQWLEGEISFKKREIDVYKNDNTILAKSVVDSRQRDLKILETIKKDYENNELKQESILTNEEKEWLKNVCRPFKDKVKSIVKYAADATESEEFLDIYINNERTLVFPAFKKDTMYKNMKNGKQYTLEELGIYYKEDIKVKVDGRNILTVDCSTTRKI